MGSRTGISWACATVNPIIGCEKVSEACTNCYAERDFDRRKHFAKWGSEAAGGTRVMTSNATWAHFVKWQKVAAAGKCVSCDQYPAIDCATCGGSGVVDRVQTVFVNSLSDTFERWSGPILNNKLTMDREPLFFQRQGDWSSILPHSLASHITGVRPVTMDDVRARLFDAIDAAPDLMFLLLTKRPENVEQMLGGRSFKNAMLGVTCESQWWADIRLEQAFKLRHRFAGTFASVEPLLGPVDLRAAQYRCERCLDWPNDRDTGMPPDCPECYGSGYAEEAWLDWVIAGGETSPGGRASRATRPEWVREIREWCEFHKVPLHFKQWGDWGEPTGDVGFQGDYARVWDIYPGHANRHGIGHTEDLATYPAIENIATQSAMERRGVANTGRLLDGVLHDALPACVLKARV